MQIIKETVRFTGIDANLRINLNSDSNFLGAQQEINNIANDASNSLINAVVDGEKRKFKYNTALGINLTFRFSFKNGVSSFGTDGAGFTNSELINIEPNVANSFFVLDFYNSCNPNNQVRIFTTYLTKIGTIPQYLVGHDDTRNTYTTDNQFYYWYVPIWYLNTMMPNSIGYIKFSFYNAKSGTTVLFYNNLNVSNPLLKMYFEAQLDPTNNCWNLLQKTNIVDARELIISNKYTERINNTIDKRDNIKQTYPKGTVGGTVFDYETGMYI